VRVVCVPSGLRSVFAVLSEKNAEELEKFWTENIYTVTSAIKRALKYDFVWLVIGILSQQCFAGDAQHYLFVCIITRCKPKKRVAHWACLSREMHQGSTLLRPLSYVQFSAQPWNKSSRYGLFRDSWKTFLVKTRKTWFCGFPKALLSVPFSQILKDAAFVALWK